MFFEKFREAAARLPAGLVRPGAAAAAADITAAERALGVALPGDYASFLRSFDGADLFHESIVVAGVGRGASLSLLDLNPARPVDDLAFAEGLAGDRFVFASTAAVIRVRAGSEERVLAGAGFSPWLDATIAREQILYGPDGEFAPEVFDDDGEEIVPRIALRQAERALRHDPGSAEAHHDRGVALRRLGRLSDAAEAFEQAGTLDHDNPWPWFDLGRTVLDDDPRRALSAFRRAAQAEAGLAGARILAWATHAARAAGDDAAATETRAAALARQPDLVEDLRRAVAAAIDDDDAEAAAQAQLLVSTMDPTPARVRLPMLDAGAGTHHHPKRAAANLDAKPDAKPKATPALKSAAKLAAKKLSSPTPSARRPLPGRPRHPGRGAPPPRGAPPRGRRR